MKNYNIIFIHPPRRVQPNYGKNAKFRRGNFLFIPMGVFAIADFLEREGFEVKIINYPLEQYLNHNWRIADFLKNINFDVVGIDLHWIHNAYGVIEVAKIIKEINPNSKIILGGSTATYYHDQILKYYNEIDGVIRGEGEIPLLKYVQGILKSQSLDSVPNLTYRDSKQIKVNPLSYTAKTLDELNFTNISLLKNAKSYFECSRKLMGISFNLSIGRGCPFNCPFCGGGQRALQKFAGRNEVILRSPEKVIEDIKIIKDSFNIPSIFFGHGSYPANLKYWENLFGLIKKENLDIGADLEIWRLPFPKKMWKKFHDTFPRRFSSISVSPRTMSEKVHFAITKKCDPTFKFSRAQVNDLIRNANLFKRTLRIWLTIGFPFQTRLDVLKDFLFIMKCALKYGITKSKPITIMNELYHIFPGSPAHESPEDYAVKLKYKSFPEIAEAFKRSKISYFYGVINYDSKIFSASSIRIINTLSFLSTINMLLTTGSKQPEVEVSRNS